MMESKKIIKAKITGMHCDGCVVTVKKALGQLTGINRISIDSWKNGNAEIQASPTVDNGDIEKAVKNAGYSIDIEQEIMQGNGSTAGDFDYDLIIIGGGSAAFAAALRASELGKKTLMINDGLPTGGTCVNVGCVPSKTLIRTAEAFYRSRHTPFESVQTNGSTFDFKKAIEQKRALVEKLRQKKYIDVIADDPLIQTKSGRARLENKHSVTVNEEIFSARNILIATGSSTFVPEIPGLKEAGYLTNETLYELEELPEHLIIIGGRYMALENAQLFARLGSNVTILQRSLRIFPDEQEDLTSALTSLLESEGITVKTGVQVHSVQKKGNQIFLEITADGKTDTVQGTHLFLASGRQGNTEELGLQQIGIETFGRQFVKTDEFLRTNIPNIFAAGDVIGKNLFVYTAGYEGGLAVENAFSQELKSIRYQPLPWVIFTDPQVAGVGMDEKAAEEAGIEYETSVLPLSEIPRSLAARDIRGFIKLIRNAQDDTLIGARILAPEGSELLMQVAMAIKYRIPVSELRSMLFPYLTLSEGIKLAAITFEKDVAKLSCCAS